MIHASMFGFFISLNKLNSSKKALIPPTIGEEEPDFSEGT